MCGLGESKYTKKETKPRISFTQSFRLTCFYSRPSLATCGRCEMALQMPGGLDLLVYRDFITNGDEMVTEVEDRLEPSSDDATSMTAAEGTRTTKTHLYWQLWPGDSDVFALKCAGFVPDHNQDYESICCSFCATCTYPTSLDVRSMLADGEEFDALYGALPTAVINPSIRVYAPSFWFVVL